MLPYTIQYKRPFQLMSLKERGKFKMNKEQFIRKMNLIQNFHSSQQTLSSLINKLTDGYNVVDFGNYLVSEIIDMINEDMKIEDQDLLDWWLYEDVDKIIFNGNGKIDSEIRNVDQLYDYIDENYNKQPILS
jgi:hypothetical protein